ncbi:MAG: hypothetical protein V5A39_15030 [Haloarculaceae archaeon]
MHIQDVLPRDAIPSIDDPTFGTEYIGDDDDDVIVVETTPARSYPVRILSFDLLHALKDVESDHRISADRGVRGSNPHSRGTGDTPEELSFPPPYRAVARSNRPHRIPCHRRANHRWFATPCGSGTALTESVPVLTTKATVLNLLENGPGSLDPRLKTGVCACLSIQYAVSALVVVVVLVEDGDEGVGVDEQRPRLRHESFP